MCFFSTHTLFKRFQDGNFSISDEYLSDLPSEFYEKLMQIELLKNVGESVEELVWAIQIVLQNVFRSLDDTITIIS